MKALDLYCFGPMQGGFNVIGVKLVGMRFFFLRHIDQAPKISTNLKVRPEQCIAIVTRPTCGFYVTSLQPSLTHL